VSETQDALLRLIQLLVDQPGDVVLDEIPGSESTLLELQVAPDDLGKVIGRQGRTARSLRSLLSARSDKDGKRYEFEILEI
jgi:predicted RNA-binding protein YlqC (UPF0109 family)